MTTIPDNTGSSPSTLEYRKNNEAIESNEPTRRPLISDEPFGSGAANRIN